LKTQTACYQDVDDVLDLSYVPSTAEGVVLFKEKQKYMYLIQASCRKKSYLTDQGADGGIVLTQGSLNAILIKRLISAASTTMRSPLPFLLSLLELLQDLNKGMLLS
jgi:hypothetical protein